MVSGAVIIVCLGAGLVVFVVAVHMALNKRQVGHLTRRRAQVPTDHRTVTTGGRP